MHDTPFLAPRTPGPWRSRLLCIPFAGGGAGIYRTWQQAMGPDVEVLPVQLAGRERRLREPPHKAMGPLIAELAPAMLPLTDLPYAIFGHSMGGAVAWELAIALTLAGRPPARLFVSARRAPDQPIPHPPLFALPDDRLVAEVERLYGPFPDVLRQHPSLLAAFLPTLRADMQVLDTWVPAPGAVLDVPITALVGDRDHVIPPETVAPWSRRTRGPFHMHVLPGGHFFVRDSHEARDQVAAALKG